MRQLYRWAEPDCAIGISKGINNSRTPVGGPASCPWKNNNCGPNEEIFSFHPGGAHAVFCDGHVAFLRETMDPRTSRTLITRAGGTGIEWASAPDRSPGTMRYLVTARVKPGKEVDLLRAIESGTLGAGSVAGGEYLRNMSDARLSDDGRVRWVEVCFCDDPLAEERPFWEEFFDLVRVQDAHRRGRGRDANGSEPWACCGCDCTARLEARLAGAGRGFLDDLRWAASR